MQYKEIGIRSQYREISSLLPSPWFLQVEIHAAFVYHRYTCSSQSLQHPPEPNEITMKTKEIGSSHLGANLLSHMLQGPRRMSVAELFTLRFKYILNCTSETVTQSTQ
jgi:hypothetical protein